MSIIITKKGKNAQKLDPTAIPREDYLQRYIYENPESLPLDEIDEDLHLLILAREFPTSSGSIDALGVDQEGSIYVIETKLYKNPDKRTVLAQVLDYGASLWRTYADPREFLMKLETFTNDAFEMSLVAKIEDAFSISESEGEALLDNVSANFSDAKLRFVVLMDHLDQRLKDLINFVNQNSRFDILGVELEFYRFEEYELVIPKLYGAEVKKEVGYSGSKRRTWNETSFFEDASQRMSEEDLASLREIYSFSRKRADRISWGTGYTVGSFNPRFNHICPRSLYTVNSDGRFYFNFHWLDDTEIVRRVIDVMISNLKDIEGLDFPLDRREQVVPLSLDVWSPKVKEIIDAIEKGINLR